MELPGHTTPLGTRTAISTATGRARTRDFLGHPQGLTFLFATEMWERFSYYSMYNLLVLYMVLFLFHPGRVEKVIGYGAVKATLESVFGPLDVQPLASHIFGFHTALVYLTPLFGGLLADRVLGQRRTVVVGALLMAIGHFMMAFEQLFFLALLMLMLGNGAFKPNISTQVGGLYAPGDPRRDRAYTIFYVGINLGAFFAPLVAGTLGLGFGWHYGFGAAGVGMLIGLAIYLYGSRTLPPDEMHKTAAAAREKEPLTRDERQGVIALVTLSTVVMFFWATYDQQGNTIMLWANDFTDRSIDLIVWKGQIPTTWFQALNPFLIFAFTPLVIRLWARQAARRSEPSTVTKMARGYAYVAVAYLIMAGAAWVCGPTGKASALWLVGYFVALTIGELHLAPVGLALVSKIAPARMISLMMGVWLAASFPGDILAGWLGSFWTGMDKTHFFLMIAMIAALAGAVTWAFDRPLKPILER